MCIKLSELSRSVAKTGRMDYENGGRGRPVRPAEVPVRDVVPMPLTGHSMLRIDGLAQGVEPEVQLKAAKLPPRHVLRPYNLLINPSKTNHNIWEFLKLIPGGEANLAPTK